MRRILVWIAMTIVLIGLVGCTSQIKINSDHAVSLYSQLSGFKGIELYVWEDKSANKLLCGMLEGTNRVKIQADYGVLFKNPIDITKAKEILQTFKSDTYIFVSTINKEKLSPANVNIVKSQLDELRMKNLSYSF